MTFGQAIAICFMRYADFNGRATRPEYWWFVLFLVIAVAIGYSISEVMGGVVHLALLLPSLSVGARRLHDTNRSGWMLLIGLVPLVGFIILIVMLCQPAVEPNRFGEASTQ